MQRQQLQLKELLMKKTVSPLPGIQEILQTYKSYKQFEEQIVKKIHESKSNEKSFEEQGKELREKFKLAFQALDKQIGNTIDGISHKNRSKTPIHQNQSLRMTAKMNTRSKTNAKYCLKQVSNPISLESKKTNLQKPQEIDGQNIQQEITSLNTKLGYELKNNKNLTFVSKKTKKTFEIYACFLCLVSNQTNSMWQKKQPYLNHMKSCHDIHPSFEKLLELGKDLSTIVCSHVFFKGELVDLMKNVQKAQLRQIFYCLSKKNYQELYFCRCMRKKYFDNFPITAADTDFYQHVRSHGTTFKNWDLPQNFMQYCSHKLVVTGNLVTVKLNQKFSYKDVEHNFRDVISFFKDKYLEKVKQSTFRQIIAIDKLNFLELLSCNKQLMQQLTHGQIFTPFPYCKPCEKYFENNLTLIKHYGFGCGNKQKQEKSRQYDLNKYIEFRSNTKEFRNLQLPFLGQISQQQEQNLKAQLFLMTDYKTRYNAPYICGECLKVFKFSHQKKAHLTFMQHIYFQHSSINHLNTHYFVFLQQQPAWRKAEEN